MQQQVEHDQQIDSRQLLIKPFLPAHIEAPLVGQTVVVSAFKFIGNTLLSDKQLSLALAPLLGRPLDFARLQSSPVLVADLYRDNGWVVQTLLPEQDIAKGPVTLEVVEAIFGQTLISGTPGDRVSKESVLSLFARQQRGGEYLNINAVDRALLLADDLPGVTVSGALGQGAQAGQTDLILQLADEPWFIASVSADNTGAVSTGTERIMASLNLNSPNLRGDALGISVMASLGVNYGRIVYSLPVGSDGARLGVSASRLNYRLASDAYKDLNASGDSSTSGLELSYPLVRSRTFNINTSLATEKKEYFNVSGGGIASAYGYSPVSLGASGNSFDGLGGGGANAFSLVYTNGDLNLSGSPTQGSDATTTQTAGSFEKVNYSVSRQQQISPSVSLYSAFSGQWASKNLDSSEKFYLGGSNGVRAYPGGEGGGTLGQTINLELRMQLTDGWSVVGFYDFGRVTTNVRNDFVGAPGLNTYALEGAGIALAWRGYAGLHLQASYARRMGDNPNAVTTEINRGADQDGTLQVDRLWLKASLSY